MIKKLFFIASVLLAVLVLISCQTDDTDDLEDPRDKILGTWDCVSNDSELLEQRFTVVLTKSSVDNRINISNFHNLGGSGFYVEINGYKLTIPPQNCEGWDIEGTGTITTDFRKINWTYTIDEGNGQIDANATFNSGSIATDETTILSK